MAKTALQIINRAMHKAKIKALGITLSQDLIDNCVEELNDIMFQLAADGIHLGFTELTDSSSVVTVPFYANGFVSSYLAWYICTEAGVTPPQTLAIQLEEQMRIVEKNTVDAPRIYHSEILPTGNSDAGFWSRGAFFGDQLAKAHTTRSGDYLKTEEGKIIGVEDTEEDGDTL